MKLKVKNGFIEDEDGKIQGTVSDTATAEVLETIECGSELVGIAKDFVFNGGSFTPKTSLREFEVVLDKYSAI